MIQTNWITIVKELKTSVKYTFRVWAYTIRGVGSVSTTLEYKITSKFPNVYLNLIIWYYIYIVTNNKWINKFSLKIIIYKKSTQIIILIFVDLAPLPLVWSEVCCSLLQQSFLQCVRSRYATNGNNVKWRKVRFYK